jgi:hypothetical protein
MAENKIRMEKDSLKQTDQDKQEWMRMGCRIYHGSEYLCTATTEDAAIVTVISHNAELGAEWYKVKMSAKALSFFKSVIQSGESWSETCQRTYDDAMSKVKSSGQTTVWGKDQK